MKLKVNKIPYIEGEVFAPSSKSYTHRAVILASLASGTSKLYYPLISDDTMATIGACRIMGADINQYSSYLEIKGTGGNIKASFKPHIFGVEPEPIIYLGNSGTSLRLLTSVAALSENEINFTGDESLQTRPMDDLLNALKPLGVKTNSNNGKAPIEILPGFEGGETSISGSISSQFISSILISAPLSTKGVKLNVLPEFVSKPYVDMTIDIMNKFNVDVEVDKSVKHDDCSKDYQSCSSVEYNIPPQKYNNCEYIIEGDYSSSSYLLGACGTCGGELTVLNLFKDSKQGDKVIIDILKEMGADISIFEDSVTIKSDGNLKGIEVDLSNAPDLLITVAVLGALASGETKITGVKHSRFKETDRISSTCEELIKCGCVVEEFEDGMTIKGQTISTDKELVVNSHKDHRLAMAFTLIGLKYNITIEEGDAFTVSFPNFMEKMEQLNVNLNLEFDKTI